MEPIQTRTEIMRARWAFNRWRLISSAKNKTCFSTQEPIHGPYFLHVEESRAVFKFDPCALMFHVHMSKNPTNPWTKTPLNKVEIRRLNRVARRKNPYQIPVMQSPVQEEKEGTSMEGLLLLATMNTINQLSRPMNVNPIQDQKDNPMQELFERTPSEMVAFIQGQIRDNTRDQNWIQFMQALANICARRFNRIHLGVPLSPPPQRQSMNLDVRSLLNRFT
jgi:hypothetical protein